MYVRVRYESKAPSLLRCIHCSEVLRYNFRPLIIQSFYSSYEISIFLFIVSYSKKCFSLLPLIEPTASINEIAFSYLCSKILGFLTHQWGFHTSTLFPNILKALIQIIFYPRGIFTMVSFALNIIIVFCSRKDSVFILFDE